MGKQTEQKLKKVLGAEKLEQIKQKKNKAKKPTVKKKSKLKIITEDMESRNTTIILVALFIIFGGLGVYFKFVSNDDSSGEMEMKTTEFFGNAPDPVDNMLEVQTLTKEQLQKYTWTDNPIALAEQYEVISIFRGSVMKARIKINLPEYKGKLIPLRGAGDFLTPKYKIIDIQDPVVFLSDKNGKLHRLLHEKSWNIAASIFNWNKDLFSNFKDDEIAIDYGIMTEEEVKITFGDYKLVDATEEQISELRKWENENSGHSFFEFETQCKKLDITFKLRIPPAWSGRSSTTPN